MRKGYHDGEVEIFCRIVSPSSLVPFAIRECTDYSNRRVRSENAEAKSTDRRFGFVATLSLRDEKDE
jgi:hypothetical protein